MIKLNQKELNEYATTILNYYDIFKDSFLVKANRKIRIQKELKNIKSNINKN